MYLLIFSVVVAPVVICAAAFLFSSRKDSEHEPAATIDAQSQLARTMVEQNTILKSHIKALTNGVEELLQTAPTTTADSVCAGDGCDRGYVPGICGTPPVRDGTGIELAGHQGQFDDP